MVRSCGRAHASGTGADLSQIAEHPILIACLDELETLSDVRPAPSARDGRHRRRRRRMGKHGMPGIFGMSFLPASTTAAMGTAGFRLIVRASGWHDPCSILGREWR
jgi:hypothetical protein